YDPELIVHRRPRASLRGFAKMLMTYGRGRAEQFRSYPTFGSALNFAPPLFCLYLILFILALPFAGRAVPFLLIPLAAYGLALLAQAAVLSLSRGLLQLVAAIPLIFLTHVHYGLGFWRGLLTTLRGAVRGAPHCLQ